MTDDEFSPWEAHQDALEGFLETQFSDLSPAQRLKIKEFTNQAKLELIREILDYTPNESTTILFNLRYPLLGLRQ